MGLKKFDVSLFLFLAESNVEGVVVYGKPNSTTVLSYFECLYPIFEWFNVYLESVVLFWLRWATMFIM